MAAPNAVALVVFARIIGLPNTSVRIFGKAWVLVIPPPKARLERDCPDTVSNSSQASRIEKAIFSIVALTKFPRWKGVKVNGTGKKNPP